MKSDRRQKCPVCGRSKMTYTRPDGEPTMFRHYSYQPSQNAPVESGIKQWLPCPGSHKPVFPKEVAAHGN